MEIISRSDAIELGLTRFFTGEPCKRGHRSERNTKGCYCIQCNVEDVAKYKRKTGYSLPPEYYAEWRARNKEKVKMHDRRRSKSWLAERAARRRQRTPSFLTDQHKQEMREIYEHARDCTTVTGEMYEVDHIIPLNGEKVSGLHVPWNLQVIQQYINRKKNNHFEDICNV